MAWASPLASLKQKSLVCKTGGKILPYLHYCLVGIKQGKYLIGFHAVRYYINISYYSTPQSRHIPELPAIKKKKK